MVIFQYNLYIFGYGCLTNTVYAMDPNNSVIKRLWCMVTAQVRNTQPAILIYRIYPKYLDTSTAYHACSKT